MDVFEAIKKRRSVRDFEKTDVPMEDLEKIVDAGRLAPSGSNIQPREFVIITDPDLINKLSKIQDTVGETSALIGVISDPDKSDYWLEDMAASVENMLLAIVALGYDSCWVEGTLLRKEKWAKNLLGVPEEKRLMAILPIGEAASPGVHASKKQMSEITHYDGY